MKRHDPLHSRRENSSTPPPSSENLYAKSIGCMSGVFQLLCKYQIRRRFLTFGKNQETTNKSVSSSPTITKPRQQQATITKSPRKLSTSCQVNRSPTLPAEIRQKSNSLNSLENLQSPKPPALVARLMGLEHAPPSTDQLVVAEKRRRLLGALEKCDEDLKTLKKIIEAVKGVDHLERGTELIMTRKRSDVSPEREKYNKTELQPSSVRFNELTHSTPIPFSSRHNHNGRVLLPQQQKKKPGEEETISNHSFIDRRNTQIIQEENVCDERPDSPIWSSKAMVESVNEVCRDIEWGQSREINKIGVALQGFIIRELIEETVKEILMGSCGKYCNFLCNIPLPFDSCKRRLTF